VTVSPQFIQDLHLRCVGSGLASVPALATAARGDCAPCTSWLCPGGVGWPKAEGLGRELGQGREATVALGSMEP
jgi:hypothetical protein